MTATASTTKVIMQGTLLRSNSRANWQPTGSCSDVIWVAVAAARGSKYAVASIVVRILCKVAGGPDGNWKAGYI